MRDPQDIALAEQQHRLPLEIVEAFKAGADWYRQTCRAEMLDTAAKHYAMTGENSA